MESIIYAIGDITRHEWDNDITPVMEALDKKAPRCGRNKRKL